MSVLAAKLTTAYTSRQEAEPSETRTTAVIIDLFTRQHIKPSRGLSVSRHQIDALFNIASSNKELAPLQRARQIRLQDAVIAFSSEAVREVKRVEPVSTQITSMQQQQQAGGILKMRRGKRVALRNSQKQAQMRQLAENLRQPAPSFFGN